MKKQTHLSMTTTLLIGLLAASLCSAQPERAARQRRPGASSFAANQVEKLRSKMESNEGFLRADTLVEQDAALPPRQV